jgi:hypothetical protein
VTDIPVGRKDGRISYSADDLRDSVDDVLYCDECRIAIDPGSPLRYLVRIKEGFAFYHEGECAETAAGRTP